MDRAICRAIQKFQLVFLLLFLFGNILSSSAQQKTYCNPINIDYGYTPIRDFTIWGKHVATADPVIVNYKNDYYLFSTNQWDIGENGISKEQSDEN